VTLPLRKQHAQARIEGRKSFDRPDDDYAVADDTIVTTQEVQAACAEVQPLGER